MDIKIATPEEKIKQLRSWINDLQSGMFVNCVYCGHRYGPTVCSECGGGGISKYNPDHMADKICETCNGNGYHKEIPFTYGPAPCEDCNGTGRTDDHVNGITHCSACEGSGEGVPVAMADVLKQHIMHCPDHPMNAMRETLEHVATIARLALSNYPEMNEVLRLQIEEIRRCSELTE